MGIALIAVIDVLLAAAGISRGDALGIAIGALIIVVGIAIALRAAGTVLMADNQGVTVRNILKTVNIAWPEIAAFYVGRYKLWGCVLIIRLTAGNPVPVFAVQGITGQPRRKTSIKARAVADELNRALEEATGRSAARSPDYPSQRMESMND